LREKRAAESELDKMTRHIPAEADRLTMAVEEMHSKLCASERDKNEAIQRLERYPVNIGNGFIAYMQN
jgi:hypothetical protein